MKTTIILLAASVAFILGLGACASVSSLESKAVDAIPDITSIVADATSKNPDYAADISTGIDLANDFEPGTKVPLTQLTSAVESGINVATGGNLTSTAGAVAAALKVLPDVVSAEQATQALIKLSKQASAASTSPDGASREGVPEQRVESVAMLSGTPVQPYRVSVLLRDEPDPSAAIEISPLASWWVDEGGVEYQGL